MSNGIFLDNPEQIAAYRLLVLRGALKLEIKGIRMSRGGNAWMQIKREFGLHGNRASVLSQFEGLLRARGILSEVSPEPAENA